MPHKNLRATNTTPLEDWPDYIKRATIIAESQIRNANIDTWPTTCLRRKWKWAAHIASQQRNRWSRLAVQWQPKLDMTISPTSYRLFNTTQATNLPNIGYTLPKTPTTGYNSKTSSSPTPPAQHQPWSEFNAKEKIDEKIDAGHSQYTTYRSRAISTMR